MADSTLESALLLLCDLKKRSHLKYQNGSPKQSRLQGSAARISEKRDLELEYLVGGGQDYNENHICYYTTSTTSEHRAMETCIKKKKLHI